MAKRVLILGSTGSIGEQALDVDRRLGGARARRPLGGDATGSASPRRRASTASRTVALADPEAAERARAELDGVRVLAGDEGIRELIAASAAPTWS